MTAPRRYGDDEVDEIFEVAAARPPARQAGRTPDEGLTLDELQAIGREVGIAPERIAEAAASLETRGGPPARRTALGMPIGVGRSVDLPRPPTDREWDRLVAELRETFSAQGKDASQGELREWRNGNLHASIEPTADGWRLRLGTVKGGATDMNRAGGFLLLFAFMLVVIMVATGKPPGDFAVPAIIAALGAGSFGYNALRLPGWAREREAQMEHIAARARAMLAEGGTPPAEGADRIAEAGEAEPPAP